MPERWGFRWVNAPWPVATEVVLHRSTCVLPLLRSGSEESFAQMVAHLIAGAATCLGWQMKDVPKGGACIPEA